MASRSSASFTIDDDEGPSAPTTVSLTPSDGTLTVTWTSPASSGATITEYHIRHRRTPPASGWQPWTLMHHENGGVLQRDITGLANGVEYDVQVRAVSADGDGTWSETAKDRPRPCPFYIELADCQILLGVRDTLVGGGTALNWAIGLPIEEWTGIWVDRLTRRVVNLHLSGHGLSGTIPTDLGMLTSLTLLSLSNNRLTGTIPAELGGLTNLDTLWLHENKLTGTIPAELARPSSMRQLFLSDNRLTGSIPSELGRLTNLTDLALSDNQLTGVLPRTLGNLTNLTRLSLGGNQLTGCMPASLRDVERNDLHRLGLPDCPPASVINLAIDSSPLDGRAYGAGERIEASVWFETDVTVSGSPQLTLMIGSEVRAARFIANRRNGQLAFRYVAGPADRDSDGISIASNALLLNGGRIQDNDGEAAMLDLGEYAIFNHPYHQVRGALRELVPDQELEAGGEALTLDLSRYFNVPEDGTLTYGTPISSDPAVATATIEDGLLKIMPQEGGIATITVTATDNNGVTVTLSFRVTVTVTTRGLRPWLMGILAEQEAGEVEEAEANDPQ